MRVRGEPPTTHNIYTCEGEIPEGDNLDTNKHDSSLVSRQRKRANRTENNGKQRQTTATDRHLCVCVCVSENVKGTFRRACAGDGG